MKANALNETIQPAPETGVTEMVNIQMIEGNFSVSWRVIAWLRPW